MTGRFDNILETIGRTPVVRVDKLAPEGVNLYVKIEAFNPMGAVKDRLARLSPTEATEVGKGSVEFSAGETKLDTSIVAEDADLSASSDESDQSSVADRAKVRDVLLAGLTFLDEATESGSMRLERALRALVAGIGRLGTKGLSIEEIDGEKARSSGLAEAFVDAGFRLAYRGFEIDRPPGPGVQAR